MSRKRFTPEQIIGFLREAEVGLSQGDKVGPICRRLGISVPRQLWPDGPLKWEISVA